MTNNAVVTPPVLQAAQDVASHIFCDAGIEVHWTDDVTVSPPFRIAMRANDDEGPFARTLRTRHVLGGLMAHEIGHMLLPDMVHSSTGLMRSGWDAEDLTHAQLGALRLTREQGEQIHARLSHARTDNVATR